MEARRANWNKADTVFAFIKVGAGNAKHPIDFVPLAKGGGRSLEKAVSSNKIDLHIRRGRFPYVY